MKRNAKIVIYALLCMLLLALAPATVFTFAVLPVWVGVALLAVGLIYALVCMCVNLIKQKQYEKSLLNTPMSDLQTQFEQRREEIQSGIKTSTEKLSRLMKKVIAYNLSLLLAFTCISCGLVIIMRATITLTEEFSLVEFWLVAIIACAYLYVFYMPVAATLFRVEPKTSAPFWRTPLSEKEYPLLYAVAERSAEAAGYKKRFRLLPGDESGISVSEEGGTVYINLSPALLPLLTEEELYSILVHEFAHAMHSDTKQSEKYSTLNYRYGERKGFEKIARAFLSYAGSLIEREIDFLLHYSSIVREKSADEEVKKHASAQAFMDATAKSYLFDEIFREPILTFAYDLYEAEKPPEDYYRKKIAYFEEHAQEFYPHTLEIIMRRLPAKNDTHPTFKMRAETFGISEFDPFRLPDGEYREETFKFSDACGKELYHSLLQQWQYLHKANYENVKEFTERYEQNKESASEALKLLALNGYRNVNYDKALALAESISKEDEKCNSAKYIKGFILCVRDDEAGLPLLLDAIRGDFNLADAFDLYGDTILRTGKQELLDELRAMQAPFGQEILDKMKKRMKEGGVKASRLVPCQKDERYEKIASSVQDIAEDGLKGVYLCEDSKGNGRKIYAFASYPADEKAQSIAQNLQLYFSMLWRENEEYYFIFCKPTDKLLRTAKAKGEKIL